MAQSFEAKRDEFYLNMPDASSPLDIRPVGGRIGAQVHGVSLKDADDSTLNAIRAALVRHKAIFFRGQHLSNEEHEAFAIQLGTPDPNIRANRVATGARYLVELNSSDGYAADIWHTDQTYLQSPPDFSMLRSIVSPPAGGDTMWANTVAAYDDLPAPLKALVDNLWGIHNSSFDYTAMTGKELSGGDEKWQQSHRPKVIESEHPVVRTHPETGERNLLIGMYCKRFVGFSEIESQRLMAILQDYVTRPENTVRWRWEAGDVVFWDNRSTQHRAIVDYGTQQRVMRRAVLACSTPVGIDGRLSKALSGLESEAA